MACKSSHSASGPANTAVCGTGNNGATGVFARSDTGYGAWVETDSSGAGIYARGAGDAVGVWADGDNSAGVYANSYNASGVYAYSLNGHAVYATSSHGEALRGWAQGASTGIVGESTAGTGIAGFGGRAGAGVSGHSERGSGVVGRSASAEFEVAGVMGTSPGVAVAGFAEDVGFGVIGSSDDGYGVFGTTKSNRFIAGVSGEGPIGVEGISRAGGPMECGVLGMGDRIGVQGWSMSTAGNSGIGVYGRANSGYSVYGEGLAQAHPGVFATRSPSSNLQTLLVLNEGLASAAWLRAMNVNNARPCLLVEQLGTGLAAEFSGDVQVLGNLMKSGGGFQIDHPLDRKKLLQHSFVESSEMLNLYAGTVRLDARGRARVRLPRWFSAINKDFAYQLTCIGAASGVYIEREMRGGSFEIAGGRARQKVCWQVTAVRKDRWANANRIKVEVPKPSPRKTKLPKLPPMPKLPELAEPGDARRRIGAGVTPRNRLAPPKLSKPPKAPKIRKPAPVPSLQRPKDAMPRPGASRGRQRADVRAADR